MGVVQSSSAPLQRSSSVIDVVDIKRVDTVGSMRSEVLSRLHAYWRDKAKPGALPARSGIAPIEIATLLPHVIVIDIRHDPLDLVYRLVGTTVVRIVGREIRGIRVQDLPLSQAAALGDAYALTARDGLLRRIMRSSVPRTTAGSRSSVW